MYLLNYVLPLAFMVTQVHADYLRKRNEILESEKLMAIGGNIKLSQKEKLANEILLAVKNAEMRDAREDVSVFPPSRHFFEAKSDIEKSRVFSIMQRMPKGASLHTHLTASVSLDYVFANLLGSENLYGCRIGDRLKLKFFEVGNTTEVCKWELLKDLRESNKTFDNWVRGQISLMKGGNPRAIYSDINDVWQAFMGSFGTVNDYLAYKPVFQDYLYQALNELYSDRVIYGEFRASFPELYELNGHTYTLADFLQIFSETVHKFKRDNPGFVGARMIYSRNRRLNVTELERSLKLFRSLQDAYPTHVAGFDLVGFEDAGNPLIAFYEQLRDIQNDTNFFFHAGETNWYGYDADRNLVDAVLLGTKRIGHGYALLKHPKVLEMVKQQDIAIEVSPISNQVLTFVDDLRNHPAAALIAQGFPVVVCNDDPGFWGAKGLSYDWYLVYMGMASKDAGLEFLKQLALNSLEHSSMPEYEKAHAIRLWSTSWERFVDDLIAYRRY